MHGHDYHQVKKLNFGDYVQEYGVKCKTNMNAPSTCLDAGGDGGGVYREDGYNWGSFVAQHTKRVEYIVVNLTYYLK